MHGNKIHIKTTFEKKKCLNSTILSDLHRKQFKNRIEKKRLKEYDARFEKEIILKCINDIWWK